MGPSGADGDRVETEEDRMKKLFKKVRFERLRLSKVRCCKG